MIGLIVLCTTIAASLWAVERVTTLTRDKQWREWIDDQNCTGPAPDKKPL